MHNSRRLEIKPSYGCGTGVMKIIPQTRVREHETKPEFQAAASGIGARTSERLALSPSVVVDSSAAATDAAAVVTRRARSFHCPLLVHCTYVPGLLQLLPTPQY